MSSMYYWLISLRMKELKRKENLSAEEQKEFKELKETLMKEYVRRTGYIYQCPWVKRY